MLIMNAKAQAAEGEVGGKSNANNPQSDASTSENSKE